MFIRTMVCFVLCICSYNCLCASDSTKVKRCKIIQANGNELVGEIVREDSLEIVLKSEGVESKVSRIQIKQITYLNKHEWESDSLQKEIEPKQEFVIGATLGSPAIYNARLGSRSAEGLSFQVSGMYSKDVYGFQLSPILLLSKNEKTYQYLSFMFGYSYIRGPEQSGYVTEVNTWTFAGVGYVLNTRGFFLELGLSVGRGSYSSPQLIFQIGYVN